MNEDGQVQTEGAQVEGAQEEPWENIDTTQADQAEEKESPEEEALEPASADHPAEPAVYPIQPKPKLSEFVPLSVEEMAEKGKLLARKLKEIEGLEGKRKDINGAIKDLDDDVTNLRNLLRQPIGGEAAAAQFSEMAKEAESATAPDPAPAAAADGATVKELNDMARDIQAGVPGTTASAEFENDVENFKAKKAKERKAKAI